MNNIAWIFTDASATKIIIPTVKVELIIAGMIFTLVKGISQYREKTKIQVKVKIDAVIELFCTKRAD